eukprot:Skav215448  [mRNA]  locus=scaffold2193:79290:80330:+ [translate_table: standard]
MHARRTATLDRFWREAHVPSQIAEQLDKEHTISVCWPLLHRRILVRKPVYLYIFSGRRRVGDYQHFVEYFLTKYAEDGQVLLVDLALSPSHDVTDTQLMNQFLEWYRSGFVAAVLAAPPCETWSQARHNPVNLPNAPRPIRSSKHPFGLDGLTKDELDQIFVSSQLLFTALRLIFGAIIHQIPATLEHPKMPAKKDRASIWFLPWLRRFLTHQKVQLVSINQAEFGAGSVKPTDFLVAFQDGFLGVARRHRQQIDWSQLDTLVGLDSSGHWKTASGKEYPPALNALLAESHVVAAAGQRTHAISCDICEAHQQLFDFLYAGNEDFSNQTIRPDYARQFHKDLDSLD